MGKKTHKNAPFMCGQCKHGFTSEKAVKQHIHDNHPTIQGCGIFRCIGRVDGPDYEPSMADRQIDAMLAQSMGELTADEWLLP